VLGHLLALEMAHIAVEEAIRLGASFADARFEIHQREELNLKNGDVRRATMRTERGIGLRALVNGAWGFASVSSPTRHDAGVVARRAVQIARAAAVVQERPVDLAHEPPHSAVFRTPIDRDPLAVPLEDKIELLLSIDRALRISPLIKLTSAGFLAHRARKLYVNSEGAEIDQDLVQTGVGYQVGASDGNDFQVRSYPDAFGGQFASRGWEMVEALPLVQKAPEMAEQAIALLSADPCPNEVTALILAGDQLALQIHESCGHPVELDRVLGSERNFAGGSFLSPESLGRFDLASKIVNLYADARVPGGLGSFGFDDEGVEAQRVELVNEGRFAGYLSSRESAQRVGLERSSGAMRAASWASLPLVRMTNVNLEPGSAGDLEALIADTPSGILMTTNRSWSIDDQRKNFQFGCEVAWEVKNGKRTRLLKNPTYGGVTPAFWRSCDAICDKSEWKLYGAPVCGKGQPFQLIAVGHGASPARFQGVQIGAHQVEIQQQETEPEVPAIVDHPEENVARKKSGKRAGKGKRR
jgi:TldD protein